MEFYTFQLYPPFPVQWGGGKPRGSNLGDDKPIGGADLGEDKPIGGANLGEDKPRGSNLGEDKFRGSNLGGQT